MNLKFNWQDEDTGSFQRAKHANHEIVPDPKSNGYLMAFQDSEHVHKVTLERTHHGYEGDCTVIHADKDKFERCRGLVHHDGPCAHLWAIWSHQARERRTDEDSQYDHAIEKARADGGRSIR